MPVDGAGSDIVEGAAVMIGVTDETDSGCAIVASGAAANVLGVIAHLHDYSVDTDSTPEDGAIRVMADVALFMPGCEVAIEIDQDTQLDVASYVSGTKTVTITSIEDDIDGGWCYVTDGPGAGELQYIITSASGSFITKTAFTEELTSVSDVVVLRPELHQLHTLSSNASKIITSTAAGSLTWGTLAIEFKYDGMSRWERLDYTKHSGLTGLDHLNVKFRYIMNPASKFIA
jgi:hypothetical protein